MTIAALVATNLLAFVLMTLIAAARESARDIVNLRRYSGFVDRPIVIEVDGNQSIADLPVMATSVLDIGGRCAVLIVSDRCLTCYEVLAHVHELTNDRLVVWVNAPSEDDAAAWISSNGLEHDVRVLFDPYGLSAIQLGISASPVVVHTEDGLPVGAWAVPSVRQLNKLLAWTAAPEGVGAIL